MANYTRIQNGDTDDAAGIASLSGHENLSDYVAEGLELTNVNHTDNTFDLTGGEVFILLDSLFADRAGETVYNVLITSHFDTGITSLTFADGEVNHVYARANTGVDDAPKIDVLQDQSNASDDSFRIAVIDDTQSISYEVNRNPDGIFDSLEADDVVIRESLTANGLVDTNALADYAATASKIAQNAITDGKIADDAVGSDELQNDSVNESEVSDNAITTAAIAAGSVTSSLISTGAVGGDEIKDNSVDTEKIVNKAITNSLIEKGAVDTEQLRADSVNPEQVEESERFTMDGLTSTESIGVSSRGFNSPIDSSRGEKFRMGGESSDSLFNIRSDMLGNDLGSVTWSWNAEYRGGEWKYITDGEQANAISMYSGIIIFRAATPGNSGEKIDWNSVRVNGDGISNALKLGRKRPEQYARVDKTRRFEEKQIFNQGIQLEDSDIVDDIASPSVIWKANYYNEEIRALYWRPHWILYDNSNNRLRYMLKVHKNGDMEVQGDINLPKRKNAQINHVDSVGISSGSPPSPPQYEGTKIYSYNNSLYAVNDSGVRKELANF